MNYRLVTRSYPAGVINYGEYVNDGSAAVKRREVGLTVKRAIRTEAS